MRTFIYPPQSVAVSVPPIEFLKDSSSVNVEQNTTDPTANTPLPAGLFILKDGIAYPVEINTGDPSQTLAIPVQLQGTAGPINVTAGDLNVQLTDLGPNFDATRIGDGSGNYQKINADGSSDVNIKNTSIPVTASSLPLPTGAATEAKQDSSNTKLDTLIAKDFATSAKQDTANTSLATIAGKDFATSAKQDTTNTKLDSLIAKDFATASKQDTGNASVASIDSKMSTLNAKDFATSAKQDLMNAGIGSVSDAAVTNPAVNASMVALLKGLLSQSSASFDSTSTSTVAGTVVTLTPPTGAKLMIVQNSLEAGSPVRFTGSAGTPSTTEGYYLGVGQSTSTLPAGTIKLARTDVSGSGNVSVAWFK